MRNSKLLAALLALLMVFSVAFHGVPAVSAEEKIYTDPYVCAFDATIEGYEDYSAPLLYVTPHNMDLQIYSADYGFSKSLGEANASVFNLINTTAIAEGGDGAYASIGAYCTDLTTGTVADTAYKRINLENSTYYSDDVSEKIRAIVLNSFPHLSVEEVAAAVNAAYGEGTVTDLTGAEVVLATQFSIWMNANAKTNFNPKLAQGVYLDQEKSQGYVSTVKEGDEAWDAYKSFYEGDVLFPEGDVNMYETAGEYTDSNIEAVAKYLRGLAPVESARTVISNENIKLGRVNAQQNEDGTYTLTLEYRLDIDLLASDELQLCVTYGETGISQLVDVTADALAGEITLQVPDKDQNIKVEVNGYQSGDDVYFFEAEGGISASQSLVGYDNSRLPVHAERTASAADRVVTFYKTTAGEAGAVPLKNIQFAIYYVSTLEDYLYGRAPLAAVPSESDVETYAVPENLVDIVTTNGSGIASYNFGQEDAVYLVVELPNDVIAEPVAPFYLAVPSVDAKTGELDYTVNVQPKNTVKTEDVIIEKDVNEIDNDHDTHDVGELHTWIIQSSIPTGLATGLKYEITDTLNYQLTFKGNVRVTVSEKAAPAYEDITKLVEGEDYILTVTPDTQDVNGVAEEITTFTVALTQDGMEKVAAVEGTEPEVRVYFDAVIDEDAIMFTEIPNQAHISYENNVGTDYEADSDTPEVHTGAGQILKLDASNQNPLTGATFLVYREATAEEIADETVVTETLTVTVDGQEKEITVVKVAFYDNAEMTGEKVYEVVSDENGKGVIYGLAYGTYYLVETKAPEGYNLLTEPAVLTITEADSVDEIVVTIYNSAKFKLPETGGIGTAVFTFGGAGIIGAAAMLLLGGKKKKH